MDKQKKARIAAMEADRTAAGLSFRALGAAAGVSDSRIRDAIKDVSNMTGDNWAKVAAALRAHFQASERAEPQAKSGASRTEDSKLAALLEKDGIALPAPASPRSGAQSRTEGPDNMSGITLLAHNEIVPGGNYRKTFSQEEIEHLAESIAAQGLMQNLVARQVGLEPGEAPGPSARRPARLIAGERRWRAIAFLIGQGRWNAAERNIPVQLRDIAEDEARALALIENLQRQDVPVLEEAEGFKALTEIGWDTERIAAACHIAQRTVQDRLTLFDRLKPVARAALARGEITLDQARAIVSTPSEAEQNELVTFAVQRGFTAANLRDKAKSGKVRVSKAEFDLKHYKGEFIGAGDARVFADTDAFMKLQLKEAKKRAGELRASGRFRSVTLVGPGEEGFAWQAYDVVHEEDVTDENAATLDVWVSVDKWQHTIKIDYGRPDGRSAEDADLEDDPQTDLEREIAAARRKEDAERQAALTVKWLRDMGSALAERPADWFRREIWIGLTGHWPAWRASHLAHEQPDNLPATLEILREATGRAIIFDDMPEDMPLAEIPRNEHIGKLGEFYAAFLAAWLDEQPDMEVIRLHVRLEASRAQLFFGQRLDTHTAAMSQKLGVTVPDHLLPEAEEEGFDDDGDDAEEEAA